MPRALVLPILTLFLATCTRPADLRVSALFTDGMVLQREMEVPVWGTAAPGSEITVTTPEGRASATTGADGSWMVYLAPMPATAEGFAVTITARSDSIALHDVVVGDVWLASGQSNMEWPVGRAHDAEATIATAGDPGIRHFHIPHLWSEAPVDSVVGGPWHLATPEYVGEFTAVGYFFAQQLREHVGVPIGILHSSWGGSRVEPWMTPEALGFGPPQMDSVFQEVARRQQEMLDRIEERLGPVPTTDEGLVDGEAPWAEPDLDESEWATVPVPAAWETEGYGGVDGIVWYRVAFELTQEEAASGVTLGLGMIDDSDRTWLNGWEIGGMQGAWDQERVYAPPAGAVRSGRNVIAVRVEDTGGQGGIMGSPDQLFVETSAGRRSLAGEWAFRLGAVSLEAGIARNQMPMVLYNAMIHPLLDFPIKGAIWYQGEANANGSDAFRYRDLFAAMIQDWRARWAVGDFPFLYVQLASYMAPSALPEESDWAVLRESQSAVLSLPNTGQAVIIDIGEARDIHPRNKQDVGYRLSLAARHVAYGEDLVWSGPAYREHSVQGSSVIIAFDHVGSGLQAVARPTDAPRAEGGARAGVLTGFSIAGEDGRFVRADARIQGERVIVSSPSVPRPVAVRYAWADNPVSANLFNAEGLPASPFRTDPW
jgi:sialate O-acetylesterase